MMTTLNNKEQKMSTKMHKDEHYEMLNTDDKHLMLLQMSTTVQLETDVSR